MIREFDSNETATPYVNIIELVYMFLVVELHIACSKIGLYNHDEHKWNKRRLFWYIAIGMPSILTLGIFLVAAVKFILQ
jgi:hypothetical protein